MSDLFGIFLILYHVEGHRRHIERKKKDYKYSYNKITIAEQKSTFMFSYMKRNNTTEGKIL